MSKAKEFLKRKNLVFSPERYFIKAMGSMALGLFASLIIGLILKVLGENLHIPFLVECGRFAASMTGPAIGVAVAYGLGAPPLVLFASVITGAAGYEYGGPAGAFVAAVIGAELGKLISKETKLDIIVTPAVVIMSGVGIALLVGPPINSGMIYLGEFIMWTTQSNPFIMGVVVSIVMGMVLTLPISSAALAIMLHLSGLAAGAATVGCAAQMVGFAVMSFRDNGVNGLISQGLGTSMLQMPNIIKNPRIWIPPTMAAAVLGPLSTMVFKMENIPAGAGMGTSGLVGQISTVEAMGASPEVFLYIVLLHFILPAVLTLIFAAVLRRIGWIKQGDTKLEL